MYGLPCHGYGQRAAGVEEARPRRHSRLLAPQHARLRRTQQRDVRRVRRYEDVPTLRLSLCDAALLVAPDPARPLSDYGRGRQHARVHAVQQHDDDPVLARRSADHGAVSLGVLGVWAALLSGCADPYGGRAADSSGTEGALCQEAVRAPDVHYAHRGGAVSLGVGAGGRRTRPPKRSRDAFVRSPGLTRPVHLRGRSAAQGADPCRMGGRASGE
mmetsp:Transcript_9645/g.23863  ORF Transcript_9645/g.23863 Transcript_9645/m.23863 type:complete len:215 (-) Transcript_9645:313-957(-)